MMAPCAVLERRDDIPTEADDDVDRDETAANVRPARSWVLYARAGYLPPSAESGAIGAYVVLGARRRAASDQARGPQQAAQRDTRLEKGYVAAALELGDASVGQEPLQLAAFLH